MARLLIKFTKTNRAKFISHLDTMRTLHRAFRRATLPIAYSGGFNPHASISVAAPLSLGTESIAEYADIDITGDVDCNYMKTTLNETLPPDIRILEVIEIKGKAVAAMAAVAYAKYILRFDTTSSDINSEEVVNSILSQSEIMKMKRTKSGEKLVDIRPLIQNIVVEARSENSITFESIVKSGSNGSLGVDILVNLLTEASGGKLQGYPFVRREEIYGMLNEKKVSLLRYFTGK